MKRECDHMTGNYRSDVTLVLVLRGLVESNTIHHSFHIQEIRKLEHSSFRITKDIGLVACLFFLLL